MKRKHRHLSKRQPLHGLRTTHACVHMHTRTCCSLPSPPSLQKTRCTDSARGIISHTHGRPARADCGALNGDPPQAFHGISSSRRRKIIVARPAFPTAIPTCRIPSHSDIQHASAAHARARPHEVRAVSVVRTAVPWRVPTACSSTWHLPADPATRLSRW